MKVVGLLVGVELVSGIVQGMMATLTPALGAHYDVSASALTWVNTLFYVSAAIWVPLLGRLGDIHGHRRLLRVAATLFAVGTVAVAMAPGFGTLLAGRVLQAGLLALLPLEMALVRDRLEPAQARAGIGILIGALTTGVSLGLVVASELSRALDGLTQVLWVPAVATVLVLAVPFFFVPESTRRAKAGIDWAGTAALCLFLIALLLGVGRGPAWGWGSARTIGLFVLAAALLAFFVKHERGTPEPAVDVRRLGQPRMLVLFLAAALIGAASFGSQTALITFVASPPKQLGYGLGISTDQLGWYMLPTGIAALVGAALMNRVGRTVGHRATLFGSLAVTAAGFAVLAVWHDTRPEYLIGTIVMGVGNGAAIAALPAAILERSTDTESGINAGLYNTLRTVGGSIAGAIFAAVLSSMVLTGSAVPSESAYVVVLWLCAAACLLAACLTLVAGRTPAGEPAASRALPEPATA
ncbi:MFS transporter [Streptomyces sp. NPDC090306]|uniref:MFS transporter n=1 Tax=Streptomyces sp. NPDC090306 TaxID=3365961 RepID=UPI0037FD20E6